jgi:Zn finger protein HypA/HybF involved in hydrogenase expression
MARIKISLKELECKRCGWKWIPRKTIIRICPKCKTAYWDIPFINKRRGQGDGNAETETET